MKILMVPVLLFFCSVAEATEAPSNISLQGTITDSSDFPLQEPSVDFTIQLFSPGAENCLLYEEGHTLNMTNSGGTFSIDFGTGSRSGVLFQDTSSLIQVFDNSPNIMSALTCDIGTDYTPSSGDNRNLILIFDYNIGAGPQTVSQNLRVQSAPYAIHSSRLEGKSASQFVQTIDGNTQTRILDAFSTRWSELDALLSGTSNLYTGNSGANFSPSSSVDFNSQALTSLADPTNDQDAATKKIFRHQHCWRYCR